jgi:propanol-preferring alcohol dehydrogenase
MTTAMVLKRPRTLDDDVLEQVSLAVPSPGPGELLIRVDACAVCRTDLQLVEGDLEARTLPVTPGHQVAGRVELVGENASGWEAGRRVAVTWLAETCGACA